MKRYLLVLVSMLASLWAAASMSMDWIIDSEKSRLGFTATFEGIEFDGEFREFEGTIRFDPASIQNSSFNVSIDVTSADSGSSDLNDGMALPAWFHFSRYPRATFISTSIKKTTNADYETVGTLGIKGIENTVQLPFRWQRNGDNAQISGNAILRRTQFNLGEGEWADVNLVGDSVRVWADLHLVRAP